MPKEVKLTSRQIQAVAWSVTFITIALAFIVWGGSLDWHIFSVSTFHLFPIFGLVAFSLLWSQYVSLAIRMFFKAKPYSLSSYFKITSWSVLLAILLHPGLLIFQQWHSGQGLPPHSELSYVLPGLRWVVVLGMINLTILLLFELRRFFDKKPWWPYLRVIVDLVVLSVFYHGLRLGTQLKSGWYRQVWFFYGVVYLIVIGYIYYDRFRSKDLKV